MCKEALKRAGRKAEDVDLIILGTTSPDYITPSTSVVLQYKLGAKNAGAFDVGCACAAFPALVATGAGLITTNPALKTVLLVGVDMIHRLTDPNDPGCFLWSDGAGAVVLEGGSEAGLEDNWPRLFRRLSDQCGFSAHQVDQLLFTQISKSSIEVAAERCNVPVEKCHMIMQKYGYTGSACIPMALDDAIELGKIKRGDLVVMIQSGLGWNQAAAAIRMTT